MFIVLFSEDDALFLRKISKMGKFTPQQRLRYRLDRQMRKAIRDYKMIDQGDALLIGLSGGKDSLALVELLGDMSRVLVPRFKVYALHVQMTNIPYQADVDFLRRHCEAHGVEFLLRERSFDAHSDTRKSPCFLCSWNRRKALFETSQELACSKVVLGHHRDDFLETLLMNMFFQGSIQAMPPALQMDKMPLQVIRPFCLIDEADLQQFAQDNNYPPQEKNCPYEEKSHRSDMRDLLEELEQRFPGLKDSLWASMQHIYPQYLP